MQKRRFGRKLALAAGSALAALIVAEIGCRVWLSMRGTPHAAAAMRYQLRELERRAAGALPLPGDAQAQPTQATRAVLHPYFGFDADYSRDVLARDLPHRERSAEQHYDVLILGGSVAAIFAAEGTAELDRLLAADPRLEGRPARFTTYARGAYKQPQQLFVLGLLLSLGFEFDAVLCIDGFNEVALASQNGSEGMHPAWPSFAQWVPHAAGAFVDTEPLRARLRLVDEREALRRDAERMLRSGVARSALVGHLALHWLQAREGRLRVAAMALLRASALDPALLGPAFEGGAQQFAQRSVAIWLEASRSMHALCEARGIRYVQVLQPTLHDPGAKPITPEEQRDGTADESWLRGVELGYPLLRQGGARLAAEGLRFLDASRVFAQVEQTLYYDACHFRQPGNDLLARAIAPVFLEGLAGK